MRTIIDLPEADISTLDALKEDKNVSRAELIREAVSEYLKKNRKQTREEVFQKAFGLWKDYDIDGVEYQRALRAEWDESRF